MAAQEADKPAGATPAAHPPKTGSTAIRWIVIAVVVLAAVYFGAPRVRRALSTVSTDDAFVNGHVTFVAPRVAGQVAQVLVDDNQRVRKGDVLVKLDPEPFQVQLKIAEAAVAAAQADSVFADAQARGIVGHMRSLRFNMDRAIEDVHNQVEQLKSRNALWNSQKASLLRAQADFERAKSLLANRAIGKEEYDQRREALQVAQAKTDDALQGIYQVRVALGLPPKPPTGDDLTQTPPDLDQTFSAVRQAQSALAQAAAEIGVTDSFKKTPQEMVRDFYKRDPKGDIDQIYERLMKDAPVVRQATAKLLQAKSSLDQAKLNLRYCDVLAEIDGVVTRRNVNPGNNVVVGQNVMAVRSLTEVWIDANFKETQLGRLRIGQKAELEVDMYGSRKVFKGRISGFTMGTGSTLALLPAENATGNFVKVVQRLPVRIDLEDYSADDSALFFGLSVTPYVLINEPPTGPDAGKLLQSYQRAGGSRL